MARPPDGGSRVVVPPRARSIVGWIAAVAIIGAVALFVGIIGGSPGGTAGAPSGSPSPTAGAPGAIRFGTALDPATAEVASDAETDRFVVSDTFAYSYRTAEPPPAAVWVEVRRGADGAGEPVQEPAEHRLADDALVIAFAVPASALFEDFGTGPFQMRIYLARNETPAAVGSFELIAVSSSPSP